MKKIVAVPLAAALLALSSLAAFAWDRDLHRVHHVTTNTRDPNFNPYEFPLCFVWDARLHRDVWVCGRSAY